MYKTSSFRRHNLKIQYRFAMKIPNFRKQSQCRIFVKTSIIWEQAQFPISTKYIKLSETKLSFRFSWEISRFWEENLVSSSILKSFHFLHENEFISNACLRNSLQLKIIIVLLTREILCKSRLIFFKLLKCI